MSKQIKVREELIDGLQRNLKLIRKVVGWTQEELANFLGVSRQTINNLENHKTLLNATQYIAISALLEERSKENISLGNVIEAIIQVKRKDDFNNSNNTENEERNLKNKSMLTVGSIHNEAISSAKVIESAGTIVGAAAGVAVGATIGAAVGLIGTWMSISEQSFNLNKNLK